jgi:hypothetical protein
MRRSDEKPDAAIRRDSFRDGCLPARNPSSALTALDGWEGAAELGGAVLTGCVLTAAVSGRPPASGSSSSSSSHPAFGFPVNLFR